MKLLLAFIAGALTALGAVAFVRELSTEEALPNVDGDWSDAGW